MSPSLILFRFFIRCDATTQTDWGDGRSICTECGILIIPSLGLSHPWCRLSAQVQSYWKECFLNEMRHCPQCHLFATSVMNNVDHQFNVHGFLQSYLCADCDKTFASKTAMWFHRRESHPQYNHPNAPHPLLPPHIR